MQKNCAIKNDGLKIGILFDKRRTKAHKIKTDNKTKRRSTELPKQKKMTAISTNKNASITKTAINSTPHSMFDRCVASLKGNNYPVSVCVNGKYGIIAVSCNNGNLQVYKIKKEGTNNIILTKKLDEVFSCIDIDKDACHLIAVSELYSTLRIFKIETTENGIKNLHLTLNGRKELHKRNVKFLYVHNNSFILTGAELDDTEVKLWNMKGELLKTLSIKQVYNHDYAISKTPRFFGVACWSADIKVFEIKLKENVFQNIEKVIDLKTKSGTKCLCFSNNEEKAFLIDKNGILAVYNLNIRYKLQEESKILYQKDLKEDNFEDFSRICMSGEANHLIVISGLHLIILRQENLQIVNKIINAHACEIFGVLPIPDSSLFLTWANDGYIKLWNISKI
ncbi:WD repeat-containing protein [Plasmodium brasilianum]|uniref:WD repeat-containing protein n=1 Tax=Plasmodium brasilianum TaxID=5824 RepID=A0ACB9YFF2_PLABR|nr:WD repeat-containing protein [Plasmodium brasilianum]